MMKEAVLKDAYLDASLTAWREQSPETAVLQRALRGPLGPLSSRQYDFMITQHPNV